MLLLLAGHPWLQYILINTIGFSLFLYIWTYLIPRVCYFNFIKSIVLTLNIR